MAVLSWALTGSEDMRVCTFLAKKKKKKQKQYMIMLMGKFAGVYSRKQG